MEIISKEMIKPSSPTPHHLRQLNFSFLDQTSVPIYTPFLFFYQANNDKSSDNSSVTISQQLKQSLSDTLTLFYPLAGRIHENSYIDCNDNGAEFIEARVRTRRLSDIIQDPNLEELKEFLPLQPFNYKNEENHLVLSVKASFFDCGGIAVGVSLSHKIADGTSLVEFVRAWAAKCRGETVWPPRFDLMASHFPPRDDHLLLSRPNLSPSTHISSQKIVTKRLIFDKEKLKDLKDAISSAPESELKDPTRVEAASAFIWKHFIDAAARKRVENPDDNPPVALHVVNIRSRMIPPLPENAFGNCFLIAPTNMTTVANNTPDGAILEMHHLAYQLGKAIRKIDGDYIKQEVQVDGGERYYLNHCRSLGKILKDGTRLCNFTSWCRFPVYDVDYGWGKPVWVCTTPLPFKNLVVFMSTPCGEGIEAWVNVLEDDTNVIGI